MVSLKGFTPALARHLQISPAALYERQRALVRAGLLSADGTQQRGPGGGVRATALSVAHLLVAILATDNLSETEERANLVAKAKLAGGSRSPFQPIPRFVDAVAAVLTSKGLRSQVVDVRVSRTAGSATINFKDKAKDSVFVFGDGSTLGVTIEASISAKVVKLISDDVVAIIESNISDGDPH
jgi:hypothetical protein